MSTTLAALDDRLDRIISGQRTTLAALRSSVHFKELPVGEESLFGDGGDVDKQPHSFDDREDMSQPSGAFIPPPVKCFFTAVANRDVQYSVSVVEYDDNTLTFHYKIEYDGSGGVQQAKIFCDKTKLSPDVQKIVLYVKNSTLGFSILERYGDTSLINVKYKSAFLSRGPTVFSESHKIITVLNDTHSPVKHVDHNQRIMERCENIASFLVMIDNVNTTIQAGRHIELPPGPAPASPD